MSPCNTQLSLPETQRERSPRTVADVLSIIEDNYKTNRTRTSSEKRLVSALRTTCKRICEMFGVPIQGILLDDLIEIDTRLIAYVESFGISHESAVQYTCDLHKLLTFAREYGWVSSSKNCELRNSWSFVRQTLKGKSCSGGTIIDYAIELRCTPRDFSKLLMDDWKRHMVEQGRSILAIEVAERSFRRTLRDAGLQKQFPNFSLASNRPSTLRMKLKDLPETLCAEILAVIHWKTARRNLKDRDASLLIRDETGRNLLKYLLQLSGYAINFRRFCVTTLAELLTEEIVCGYIDWLQQSKRHSSPAGIITKLSSIHYLTQTYPKLKGGDYRWFCAKLSTLPREKRATIHARKLDGIPGYDSVAEIATKLLELCNESSPLTDVKKAFHYHDALLFATSISIPHRSRNLREAGISPQHRLNIFETEIDSELLSHFKLPAWAQQARDQDPRQKFLVMHWLEEHMKAGQEVWEIFPQEAIPIYWEYVSHYRPLIVSNRDPGTLFLSRKGTALTQKSLLNLVTRLSVRFTGRRMTVKLFRDMVAARLLTAGYTLEEAQDRLHHLDPYTTSTHYTGACNASDGAVALEDAIAPLAA